MECSLYYEFGNDGTGKASMEAQDYFAFKEATKQISIDAMYAEFAAMGIGQNEADALMVETYGMTIEEFVDESVESMDLETFFAEYFMEFAYYVEDGEVYISETGWDGDFESSAYTLEDDVLIMEEDTLEDGGEPLVWTRVAE